MDRKHNGNAVKIKKLCVSRITCYTQINREGTGELGGQYLGYVIGPGIVLKL